MVGKPVCAVLLVLGTIALVAGGLALYAQRAVLDRQAFADRATAALEQDEVRDEVAARTGHARDRSRAGAGAAPPGPRGRDRRRARRRPRSRRSGTRARRRCTRAVRRRRRAALAARGGPTRCGPRSTRARTTPASCSRRGDPELMRLGGGRLENGLVRAAPWAPRLASLAPVACSSPSALLIAAAFRAPTRRRGARRVGARARAGRRRDRGRDLDRARDRAVDVRHQPRRHVVGTIWDAYLGDLRLWGLAAGAVGLIAAAIRAGRARRVAARPGRERCRRAAARAGPARARLAAARSRSRRWLLSAARGPLDLAAGQSPPGCSPMSTRRAKLVADALEGRRSPA